nr:MAG TPA: hypothetical protein [Caudoviricetes sp.]
MCLSVVSQSNNHQNNTANKTTEQKSPSSTRCVVNNHRQPFYINHGI